MADKQSVDPSTLEPIMITVYSVPTTGTTVTLSQQRRQVVLLNPAGSLLALTVALPATPNDGDMVTIGSSASITSLTINGGSNTVISAITSLLLGGFCKYIWNATSSKWFRIG